MRASSLVSPEPGSEPGAVSLPRLLSQPAGTLGSLRPRSPCQPGASCLSPPRDPLASVSLARRCLFSSFLCGGGVQSKPIPTGALIPNYPHIRVALLDATVCPRSWGTASVSSLCFFSFSVDKNICPTSVLSCVPLVASITYSLSFFPARWRGRGDMRQELTVPCGPGAPSSPSRRIHS